MNVFIARDGVEIAECPRDEIAQYVRSGDILETDHYWHEGMEQWETIGDMLGIRPGPAYGELISERSAPAEPAVENPTDASAEVAPVPPKDWRVIAAISAGSAVALLGLGALLIRPGGPTESRGDVASLSGATPSPQLTTLELREKASADLKERIERLPARAAPPLNSFYYGVTVNMRKMASPRTPWIAIIRGRENTIDPQTLETVSQTEFTLNAEYTNGIWTYQSYDGVVTNMRDSQSTRTQHDGRPDAVPVIAAMLGLKIADRPKTSISIAK